MGRLVIDLGFGGGMVFAVWNLGGGGTDCFGAAGNFGGGGTDCFGATGNLGGGGTVCLGADEKLYDWLEVKVLVGANELVAGFLKVLWLFDYYLLIDCWLYYFVELVVVDISTD